MPRQATRNVSSAATRAADLPGDGNLWEVRMHELARELSGQLDSKIVIVQQLVRHAEQQTARLELAIAEARRWGLRPDAARASAEHGAAATAPAEEGLTDIFANHRCAAEPRSAALGPQASALGPEPAAPASDLPNSFDLLPTAAATRSVQHLQAQVQALRAAGQTAEAIARQLACPVGDIELVLSLQQPARR